MLRDSPLDPPETNLEWPDDVTLVEECPNRIVKRFATDVILEYFGESNGDGRSVAYAWFQGAFDRDPKFMKEIYRRLAEIQEIREGYDDMTRWAE